MHVVRISKNERCLTEMSLCLVPLGTCSLQCISCIEISLDASTFSKSGWQSNGESGRKANRRNLVRVVGNVTTSFVYSETNGSAGMHHSLHNID